MQIEGKTLKAYWCADTVIFQRPCETVLALLILLATTHLQHMGQDLALFVS